MFSDLVLFLNSKVSYWILSQGEHFTRNKKEVQTVKAKIEVRSTHMKTIFIFLQKMELLNVSRPSFVFEFKSELLNYVTRRILYSQ